MDWKGIAITDGTGQQDRQPAALAPGYFHVDELSFEDLLAMAAEIASSIKYYNLQNQIDGDWGSLFEADEAVIMAQILSTDLRRIESDFFRISSYSPDKLCLFMLGLANKVNRWFTRLSVCQHESGQLLARKMATIIAEKLAPELHNLCKIADRANSQSNKEGLSDFAGIWGLGNPESDNPFPKSTIGDLHNADDIKRQLSVSFYIFSNSILYLKKTTTYFLQQSLDSEQHDPATGLFIVFLRLFEKAKLQLNRFTPRHLDFYYEQILKVNIREQIAESYYLLFETRAGREKAWVEKNTQFSAGKDTALNEIIYSADEDLLVSDARLASLATLYLQHDHLISPEAELGSITRIKTSLPQLPSTATDEDMEPTRPIAWPLFGVEQPGSDKGISSGARMGFAVASALLLLEQGVRKIELGIELAPLANIELDTQISTLLQCDSQQAFRQQFSSLFARYLLSFKGCLSAHHKNEILLKAESLLPKQLAQEISSLLNQDWQGLFYKLFKKIFDIKITTEDGWLEVQDHILMPYSNAAQSCKAGLRILLSLGREVAPVTAYKADVHGGQLETELPVLQCTINPQSNFYPYSIFQNLLIASLKIDVEVSGMKSLLAYNQHGQLDPSKPFQPFGPLPGSNSYFVFGNYELARKKLLELKIDLNWAELPRNLGGLKEYYRGYKTSFANDRFKVEFSALSDSCWMPVDPAARKVFSLFETETSGGCVASKKVVDVNRLDHVRPIDAGLSETGFQYDLRTRNGFYRLTLVEPESAFGHGEFPQLLTEVLSANARRKKPEPVPNAPYTPTLNGISLAYKANTTINPSLQAGESNSLQETIFHMHPFGVETVFPAQMDKPCFLIPQYAHEGNLFIGLSGKDVSGPLSLLFHLSQDMTLATIADSSSVDWYYLAANNWKKLSAKHLLSDTTHGFLATGKITLDIPADISNGNTVMPGNYFWLRASVRQTADTYSACYSIQLHAMKVSHKSGVRILSVPGSIKANKWASIHPISGIGSIKQAYKAFGGRARESKSERKLRVSERLRHKNRALLPWDYEQLVLEQFPEVYKVKCFNSISSKDDAIKPGNVLIVVVPDDQSDVGKNCSRAMLDKQQLEQIKAYVKKLCPVFARIEVRNPLYEQVQVRCTVKFVDVISEGVNINRLNQHISDYICPSKPTGYRTRFGWSIRQADIESYIRSLDYVEFVTNFSMLHITVHNDDNYSMFDSAQGEQSHEATIRPRYPWSLAIPAEQHFIETVPVARSISAEVTGVGELAIGSTLIINGSSGYGEEE